MKSIVALTLTCALLAPLTVHAAETGPVSELFACNLKEGKTWDDWEAVNEFFADTVTRIGGAADDFSVYIWQPYRGNVEYDYVWAGYFDNLRTLGDSWQAYHDSELAAEADARWAELETCVSALTSVEQIYDSADYPSEDASDEKGMLESFRCRLQPGKTMADVRQAVEAWHAHVSALDLPFDVFMRTPLVSGTDYTHSYFAVHENAAAYGANVTAYQTHPDTAQIVAMLNEVQSCTNALWRSWQVFPPQ